MTEKEMLMKQISTYSFAMLDLNLFLDTHPDDDVILSKSEDYQAKLEPLVAEYERKFGPLTKDSNEKNSWAWIQNPWPWETEA